MKQLIDGELLMIAYREAKPICLGDCREQERGGEVCNGFCCFDAFKNGVNAYLNREEEIRAPGRKFRKAST